MTECGNIVFGTPEAELLGAVALDGEPLQPSADVKAELMVRISSGDSESARADVVKLPRRRTWVRKLVGAAAAVFFVAGGFVAGRAWTIRGMSDEAKLNALNQVSDYSQMSHKMTDGHTTRLVWSYKEHSVALVVLAGMQILRGKVVQAWSAKGRRTTSMGMYPSGSKARCAFLSVMPDEGESVMLTMEPASGSSASPSDMAADIPMGKE